MILKRAKSLAKSDRYSKIFIRPDLTPAQRELHRKLVKVRDEKNSKLSKDENGKFTGDHYFGIRGDQVVKVFINKQ